MTTRLNTDKSAVVDSEYYWREIATEPPPRGAKLQLINFKAGIAQYGIYTSANDWYTHWAPLPVFKKEE